ncbi:NEL-type E3 ubiquitin ligase domain-containing protein, partial [Endozoicomonas sp. ONNA2]|uniref:NEL-type E3 ubiquitin ligase domain-containing protein n=1 Tax=Endozoicomonas sp. ONNA2 TaxID=2828741 RepID=UPI0021485668
MANRTTIQLVTISAARLNRLISEQNVDNDVHYLVEGDFTFSHPATTLPKHLSVRGNLYLGSCVGLRELSGTLLVLGDLHLDGRSDLTTLTGKISVGRDLYLSDCTSLSTLPENLYVGHDLYLSDCTSLLTLPEHLFVGHDLYLDGCTGLRTLPEHLYVYRNLYLTSCTALGALPERLFVKGTIHHANYTSLMALPSYISDRENRRASQGRHSHLPNDIREMVHANSEMRANFIREMVHAIMAIMEIIMLHANVNWEMLRGQQFANLEQCLAFWQKLASSDAEPPQLDLMPDKAAPLISFMEKLTRTADYFNPATRPVLAQRVMAVISLLTGNVQIRDAALELIEHAITSCNDRAALALDDLETLQLRTSAYALAVEKHDPTELKALGRQMMILEKIRASARSHMRTFPRMDQIEVELAFRIKLSRFFKIPGATQKMSYAFCARVDDEKIARIGADIEESCTDAALETFLAQWEPWQKFQRVQAVPPF